jgi:lipopolysaccharide biosynthesis glycosyltransferase
MTETIDIFVGCDRSQLLAAAVLEHSIQRHTFSAVRVCPLIDLDLPEPKDLRQGSRTNFSFARFAIPQLKSYRGRGIYLDADMLVFRDIKELWDLPFPDQAINIQEDLPEFAVNQEKAGAPKVRKKQCSVMLIDCERARWNVREIVEGLDGRYSYEQLMYEMCILDEAEVRYGVPFAWNSLEHYDLDTRLIHYTDMNTQPWVCSSNRNGRHWMKEVLLMIETGRMTISNLAREVELGYFRPSLLTEIDEMPHEGGFNFAAADRYADADRKAGFVKHAEVNARKKARSEAIKKSGAAAPSGLDQPLAAFSRS